MIKKIRNYNAGMTYVELIVVLSIFSVMTSIALFDYNKFQAKVDIKVLANEIALKIVGAQKFALSGKLPQECIDVPGSCADWKPSYGIYFDAAAPSEFVYFANIDNNNYYDSSSDSILDSITILKGNSISGLEVVGCPEVTDLSIVFRRPNSGALITSNGFSLSSCISYARITITSPQSPSANIRVYPSGRIQIN